MNPSLAVKSVYRETRNGDPDVTAKEALALVHSDLPEPISPTIGLNMP